MNCAKPMDCGCQYWNEELMSDIITVKLTNGVSSYTFRENQKWSNREIHGFVIPSGIDGNTYTSNGNVFANANTVKATFLNLKYTSSSEWYQKLRLDLFQKRDCDVFFFPVPGLKIDFTNSSLFVANTNAIVTDQEIEITIFYKA
jgi:hypothetical protein